MDRELLARPLDWFTEWMQRTGEAPPDFDAMKSTADLPPLLEFADGRPVTSLEDWAARREEIRSLLCHWFFGSFPADPPRILRADVLNEERERRVVRRRIGLAFDTQPATSITIETMTPEGDGPFPVFLTQTTHRPWAVLGVSRGYLACVYPGADGDDQCDQFLHGDPEREIVILRIGRIDHLAGFIAHGGERQTGRQHQTLLGAGHDDIEAPFVGLGIDGADTGDRIDDQDRLPAADDLADGFDVVQDTGRGLALDDQDAFDTGIGGQLPLDVGRIHYLVPFVFELDGLETERFGELHEPIAELAVGADHHFIARRKEID